jgi:hypothetical protein
LERHFLVVITIVIDDQKTGSGIYFGKLEPGEHIIQVDHWQYHPEERNVMITPDQLTRVYLELIPRTCFLEMISIPPGLMFILDG